MDKLSIFTTSGDTSEVSLTSPDKNSLDDIVSGLDAITRQLELTHQGHEENLWGQEVEDTENDE